VIFSLRFLQLITSSIEDNTLPTNSISQSLQFSRITLAEYDLIVNLQAVLFLRYKAWDGVSARTSVVSFSFFSYNDSEKKRKLKERITMNKTLLAAWLPNNPIFFPFFSFL